MSTCIYWPPSRSVRTGSCGRATGALAAVFVFGAACRSTMPLQPRLEQIDATIRARYGIAPEQVDAGVLDLKTRRTLNDE